MKKYLAVAKAFFKAQIVYRFDVAMTALATVGRVLFAWILWGAVFSGRETVGDFTFGGMLSYYLVSSFLTSLEMSSGVSGEVSSRIKDGTFSRLMVIPSNPQLHFIAQTFGSAGYYAIFAVIATVLSGLLLSANLSLAQDAWTLLCALTMILLGLVFMVVYQFFIGVLAFKFQDIEFFWHLQGSITAFVTGTIFPLVLLPDSILSVLKFLPFTYVTYMPAMLIIGQTGVQEGLFGLLVLAIWVAGTLLIGRATYHRFRVKFDGVGV